MEANPAFLLQCMQKLHYIDADYRLFFSGRFESPVLEQYVRHMVQTLGLAEVVSFEPHLSDLDAWLSDKHFVVATGIGEGQVEALLGGMASGLKPVAHNFPGAAALFPPACLFNIAEEFCERVLGRDYEPGQYRRFVEDRYPIAEHLRQVNSILIQLETEIGLQKPDSAKDGHGIGLSASVPQSRESSFASPVNVANL
jgi:glycosyltransferase involved in cell wall biosynthesis